MPLGVMAETGAVRPPFVPPPPEAVALDPKRVQERGAAGGHLGIVASLDPKDIRRAGWGVVFASDADPALREALDPLIELRRQQVGNPGYFKVFEGPLGVLPDQSAVAWLATKGVGLATVDPDNGVPYHLLLVGSPVRIPFEFQYTLDLQWSVGRLDFDRPDEFAAYAKAVVDYETAAEIPQRKHAALWMPVNGDLATNLLSQRRRPALSTETPSAADGASPSPRFWPPRPPKKTCGTSLQASAFSTGAAAGAAIHGLSRPGSRREVVLPINENVRVRWLVRSGYRAIASERTLSSQGPTCRQKPTSAE